MKLQLIVIVWAPRNEQALQIPIFNLNATSLESLNLFDNLLIEIHKKSHFVEESLSIKCAEFRYI